ncbi:arylsulfatase [Rubritalea halochordaticola]|uniref:Arylsulfatase n=1 Tax=Rubritalea halochordaticola TaxID=714537 RepID=A0ABP9V1C1_9BACT
MKLISTLLTALLSCSAFAVEKPNIVLFFIDDLGWADIGANGSKFYETPNIDKLAKEGVNFTNGYSAHPVCSPTRAALMSGKAPQRVGITQWIHQPSDIHLPLKEVTVAEALKEGGYTTGYIGKWHLGEKENQLPDHQGFDWMRCVNRAGQPASYFYPYNNKRNGAFWDVPDLEDGKKGDYLTDALTNHALEFISENKGKPFFLTFAHYAVHTPLQAPKDLVDKYQAKSGDVYGKTKTPFTEDRYGTWSRGRQDNATYAGMMESLDENVGRVVELLEKENLLENTLIIFTSDNGGHCHLRGKHGATSNLPLRSGKGWNYEGGIRVPTIFYWKGKLQAHVVDTPAITMDIYPTLLDIAGLQLKPEQHLDGQSLLSVLEGKEPSAALQDRFIGWSYPHNHGSGHKPSNAIRKGKWKLIRFDAGEKYELYDLSDDLGEHQNLAKEQPEVVAELDQLLTEWLKETNKK